MEFTFDRRSANEDYIRLLMNENMARGVYLAQSKTIQGLTVTAIESIRQLYNRGVASGVFGSGLGPDVLQRVQGRAPNARVSSRPAPQPQLQP